MTSFDFVITVATGSLLATAMVASNWNEYFQAIVAIGALFIVQLLIAKARIKFPGFRQLISNEPILLFMGGEFDEEALRDARVVKEDVWAKLREANALDVSQVQAVVLETTGDISVLHGSDLDELLLTGVRRKNK